MASSPPTATITPQAIRCVIPSRLGVGEAFSAKARVLGPVYPVPCKGAWNTRKPGLGSPFNLNVQRQIQYVDNCLPEWQGALEVTEATGLSGPTSLAFDGKGQGAFPGDKRPIKIFDGFAWQSDGFHFLKLRDPVSGVEVWSNPCYVTEAPPERRLVWGDPHWQTFFSDGVRCPEELYAFARDQAFLDFGALSDHMEGVTDRQWDYFQAVTNDFNAPGRFATLHGQEWTHHDKARGAPGHRNIYYRGDGGPVLRSTDPACDTLDKLWARLDAIGLEAVAIPHHPANTVMGVDWTLGWNAEYEKAVEIYSVWGSSEKPAGQGNPRPLAPENLGGECDGRHVVDALNMRYRLGFVGGGDIHDGRPGDALHEESYPARTHRSPDQGLTAAWVPALTREHVFDAIGNHQTYATTLSRIYLDTELVGSGQERALCVRAASEDGIRAVVLVLNGEEPEQATPETVPHTCEPRFALPAFGADDFAYVRVETEGGDLAWSSPVWGDER